MDRNDVGGTADRRRLERMASADLRELTSQSDWTLRAFADRTDLSANELRALVFLQIAEPGSGRMTATALRKRMGLSAAAITALVKRLTEGSYLQRESDPRDRRVVILRATTRGTDAARAFFAGVARDNRLAMADLPDEDLEAAHRTFRAMVEAMRSFNGTPDTGLPSP